MIEIQHVMSHLPVPTRQQQATRIVTYSPAYTLVPTYECFNRCQYCNFRVDPGQDAWMTMAEAQRQLEWARSQGVIEVLILSGEVHPNSPRRSAWFQRIYDLCALALSLGLLPHTNVGPVSRTEMEQLKSVNVSMGLMLEQLTPKLLETVHRHAPSKQPNLRLQQLEQAGELQIPFTTGLLLGIGESQADWIETLSAIAQCHQTWSHIQEVILQPHRPGQTQDWPGESFTTEQLLDAIALAKQHLPAEITIQIPPNLITDPDKLGDCLAAGARDLGGIGPRDEVNPDYPHPHDQQLATHLNRLGWQLKPRLPIYPAYDRLLPDHLLAYVQHWRSHLFKHLS